MPPKNKKQVLRKESPLKGPRSYLSLSYGAITVVILFVLLFVGFRVITKWSTNGTITETAEQTEIQQDEKEAKMIEEGTLYVVKEGDSLWTIAEEKLSDGFAWGKIAELNKISDPSLIETGQKLNLPKDTEVNDKVAETSTNSDQMMAQDSAQTNKITGNTYKIMPGDDLWDIAVRAYGDGYKWIDIANANSLTDPNIIHVDNTLKLPR